MEGSSVYLADVVDVLEHQEVSLEVKQLIVLNSHEGEYGHPVVNIEPICIERVVHQNNLTQIFIQYSQIFDVGI